MPPMRRSFLVIPLALVACTSPSVDPVDDPERGGPVGGDPGDTAGPDTADTADTAGPDTAADTATDTAGATDADGDGWSPPEDCDDADADVSPDAHEVCGNDTDEDCDGAADECRLPDGTSLAGAADARILGGAYLDELGSSLVAPDLDGDGVAEVIVAAENADGGGTFRGGVYLFEGPFAGDVGAADAVASWFGADDARVGQALAAGDLDGDGAVDLVVGSSRDGSNGLYAGAAFVVRGPLDAAGGSLADADILRGTDTADYTGMALAVTDGALAVAAYGESDRSGGAGAVYVLGSVPAGSADLRDAADAILTGLATDDEFGHVLADGGDLDGDGLGDLVVGAPGNDTSADGAGAAYVFVGPFTDDRTAADADATRYGLATYDYAGYSVAGGADVDGDGYDDLVVGALHDDTAGTDAGAAYVVYGPVTGDAALGAGATLLGCTASDAAGQALALGDLDEDGFADVVVSSQALGSLGVVGAVYVVSGPLSGTSSLADADAAFSGRARLDEAGTALGLGDADGDGTLDLFAGAPGEDAAHPNAGAVFVVGGY